MKLWIFALLMAFATPAQAIQTHGLVGQALPSSSADGSQKQNRAGKYGEMMIIPMTAGLYGLADEGSYFTAMTTSPGTGYALGGATQTAWVATTPTFFLKNNASSGGKRIYLDQVRISITAAGTGITSVVAAVVLDKGSRTTSAGTALTVANANGASAASTITTGIVAGAVTASAATTPVYLYRGTLKNAAPVISDSYMVNFGAMDSTAAVGGAMSAGPAILDGGQSVLVYLWFPGSSAAASGEVQASWWER
jgi:hypothetical protein